MGEGRLSLAQYRDLLSALEILCKEPAQLTDNPRPAIKFKDAVGRKFSFPWHLCKTWKVRSTARTHVNGALFISYKLTLDKGHGRAHQTSILAH